MLWARDVDAPRSFAGAAQAANDRACGANHRDLRHSYDAMRALIRQVGVSRADVILAQHASRRFQTQLIEQGVVPG